MIYLYVRHKYISTYYIDLYKFYILYLHNILYIHIHLTCVCVAIHMYAPFSGSKIQYFFNLVGLVTPRGAQESLLIISSGVPCSTQDQTKYMLNSLTSLFSSICSNF